MKLKKIKTTNKKNVLTNYVVYDRDRLYFVLRYFLENLYFPIFKPHSKFFIVTTKSSVPRLGYQQISPVKNLALLYNQNNYSYCPPRSKKIIFLTSIFAFCILIFSFSKPHSLPKNSFTFVDPQSVYLLNYNFTLLPTKTILLIDLVFSQNLTQILKLNLPPNYSLQTVTLNKQPMSPTLILLDENSLSLDLTQTNLVNQTLQLTLDSLQTPSNLILTGHKLIINYPPNNVISLDKNPEVATPGRLEYNLPTTGKFELKLNYDQTRP